MTAKCNEVNGGFSAPTPPEEDKFLDTEHLKADLKRRSIRGGAATMSAQGVKFCLQVGSMVVLARLLTPHDFGLIAMVTAVTGFVAMFKDMGLSMATVQSLKINHGQISTLFWINVAFSLGIMLLTAGIAPVIAWFYDEPRLTWITLALASAFIFGGLTVQQEALLRRQMCFGTLAVIEVISLLVGIITGIVFAWNGAGYWALVSMQLGIVIATAIGVWLVCEWRPSLPVRHSGVRPMLAFGGNISGFNIVNYFARNLDNILIGRYCGSATLGLYSKAYKILVIPIANVREPINAVAIPALSRLQGDPDRYRRFYSRMVLLIGFLSMPMVTFLFIASDDLVLLILGKNWMGVSGFLKILAVVSFLQPVITTNGAVYVSLGQTKRMLQWGIWNSIVIVIAFVIGLEWGAYGVAIGYAIASYLMWFPTLWHCFRYSPVNFRMFFVAIWRPVFASVVMGAGIYAVRLFMLKQLMPTRVVLCFVVGALVYYLVWLVIPGGKDILRELRNYILLIIRGKSEDGVEKASGLY